MRVPVEVMEPFSLGRGAQYAPGDRLRLDDDDPSQRIAFERGWVRRRAIAAPPVDRMVREPDVAKVSGPVVADEPPRRYFSKRRQRRERA